MHNYIHPLQQQTITQKVSKSPTQQASTPFKDVLKDVTTKEVKVSKHAEQRMNERNIHIDNQKWDAIKDKMTEAKQKGITDALIVTDDATLVVSTKNNTVVTALHQDEAVDKIFTNINGTIFI